MYYILKILIFFTSQFKSEELLSINTGLAPKYNITLTVAIKVIVGTKTSLCF